jgi:hypothetical protein
MHGLGRVSKCQKLIQGNQPLQGGYFRAPTPNIPCNLRTLNRLWRFSAKNSFSRVTSLSQHSLQDIRNRDDFVVSSLETDVWIRTSLNEYLEQLVHIGLVGIATSCCIVALLQKQTPDSLPVIDVYALIGICALFQK